MSFYLEFSYGYSYLLKFIAFSICFSSADRGGVQVFLILGKLLFRSEGE